SRATDADPGSPARHRPCSPASCPRPYDPTQHSPDIALSGPRQSRLRGLGLECSARRLAVHAGLVLKDEAADLVAAHRTLDPLVEVAVGFPAVDADLPEAELEFDDLGPLVADAEDGWPAARSSRARGHRGGGGRARRGPGRGGGARRGRAAAGLLRARRGG